MPNSLSHIIDILPNMDIIETEIPIKPGVKKLISISPPSRNLKPEMKPGAKKIMKARGAERAHIILDLERQNFSISPSHIVYIVSIAFFTIVIFSLLVYPYVLFRLSLYPLLHDPCDGETHHPVSVYIN